MNPKLNSRIPDSCSVPDLEKKVSTPVNWKPGEDVIISGGVSDEDTSKKFPGGWKAPRPYLLITRQKQKSETEDGAA